LEELRIWLAAVESSRIDQAQRAHFFFAATQIAQFQKDPKKIALPAPAEPPDGPPIGADDDGDFWD
jgi:hypothetical protein